MQKEFVQRRSFAAVVARVALLQKKIMPPRSGRRQRGSFAALADRMETNAVRETRTRIVFVPPPFVSRRCRIFGAVVDSAARLWRVTPPTWLVWRERGSFACHPGSCGAVAARKRRLWVVRTECGQAAEGVHRRG